MTGRSRTDSNHSIKIRNKTSGHSGWIWSWNSSRLRIQRVIEKAPANAGAFFWGRKATEDRIRSQELQSGRADPVNICFDALHAVRRASALRTSSTPPKGLRRLI